MKRVHVIISGRVQGIGFRYYIEAHAEKLNVKGFIRNTKRGVEAVFEGEDKAIATIIVYCKKGPLLAKVTSIKVKEEKYKGTFEEFSVTI